MKDKGRTGLRQKGGHLCLTEGKAEVVCADPMNSFELVTENLREFSSEGFCSSLS